MNGGIVVDERQISNIKTLHREKTDCGKFL